MLCAMSSSSSWMSTPGLTSRSAPATKAKAKPSEPKHPKWFRSKRGKKDLRKAQEYRQWKEDNMSGRDRLSQHPPSSAEDYTR